MTKIDIFSGFLGAGKTTLIKKLIEEAYKGEKLVLIENEFGDIGIDGSFLQDAGVNITEMNSGCICCSLVGDFGKALKQVIDEYSPDRILIEPSGVGKLSDVIRAVKDIELEDVLLNSFATVVDVNKCKMYMKNFGEFFNNQIECANTVILSHTGNTTDAKLDTCVKLIREHNTTADILTTPWDQLSGAQILEVLEKKNTLEDELKQLTEEIEVCPECGHHHAHGEHHHHDHDGHCECEHHHHDHDGHCEHEHHHHDHDEHCEHEHHHHDHDEHCECEHHHHDHDEHCECEHHHHDHDGHCEHEHHHHDHDEHCEHEHHHHDHDEHCEHEHHHHDHDEHCDCGHHHHADEVFTSFGAETGRRYSAEEIRTALLALQDEEKYGTVLRAKGIVNGTEGFIHFDYVPGEPDVRFGSAVPTGRLCVIGANINEKELKELFKL